ncbi:uncharacterized protein METZ01_LOCUS269824, partial [marine metagenome]
MFKNLIFYAVLGIFLFPLEPTVLEAET